MFWSYIRKHIKTILKIRDDDDVKFIEDKRGSVRPLYPARLILIP